MVIIVRLIGIFMMCVGVLFMLVPEAAKRMIAFWKEGRRIYLAGAVRLVFSVIFLSAVFECRVSWAIYTFGILMLMGGGAIFAMGPEKAKSIIGKVEKMPVKWLRPFSIIIVAAGALILYSA